MRIHRGLVERDEDLNWLQLKANHAVRFFESELMTHFQAEEMFLFPAMQGMPGSTEVIDELLTEHSKFRRLIDQLLQIEVTALAANLKEFADTLEAHIRKEERELFPIYEEHASPETISLVERGIFGLIGSASRPRHPELLK